MLTITATGDTTLHTAGKYCPEDILVKVPAGGSGGSSGVESAGFCTINITTDYANTAMYYNGENGWDSDWLAGANYTRQIKAACNSLMFVTQYGLYSASVSAGEVLYLLFGEAFVYQVPNAPDAIVTIDIVTD